MQDETTPYTPQTSAPRARSGMRAVVIALIAFVCGAAIVAVVMSRGYLDHVMPDSSATDPATDASATPMAVTDDASPLVPMKITPGQQLAQISSIEGRLAMLEDRLSRVDYQSDAASGNAARAEGLLIAFAARRMIDRGEPLSYVADQLRLRFTNAQPNAVQTIIDFSKDPVTIDELSARLEALAPQLTDTSTDEGTWTRVRRELGSLFVVRRDNSSLMNPAARVERARLMLTSKRISGAIDEIERLPGADAASKWIADAHRYDSVQHALDLIETTAMLEPSRLNDADGRRVDQPSPLAPPAPQDPDAQRPAAAPGSASAGNNSQLGSGTAVQTLQNGAAGTNRQAASQTAPAAAVGTNN